MNNEFIHREEQTALRMNGAVNALEAVCEAMSESHDPARYYADGVRFLTDALRDCVRELESIARESFGK